MLINVKMAQPISFFFDQKKRNWYIGNYEKKKKKKKKKRGRKIFTRFNRGREKRNVGSKWTPLMQLSVNFFKRLLDPSVLNLLSEL